MWGRGTGPYLLKSKSLLEICLENTYFLFQGTYYEWVQKAAMVPLSASILLTCSWKSSNLKLSVLSQPPSMAQIHRCHLCYQTGRTQPPTPLAYQLTGPTYSVHHGRPHWGRYITFLGYSGFPRSQQYLKNNSVLETNTYWPVPPLGQ